MCFNLPQRVVVSPNPSVISNIIPTWCVKSGGGGVVYYDRGIRAAGLQEGGALAHKNPAHLRHQAFCNQWIYYTDFNHIGSFSISWGRVKPAAARVNVAVAGNSRPLLFDCISFSRKSSSKVGQVRHGVKLPIGRWIVAELVDTDDRSDPKQFTFSICNENKQNITTRSSFSNIKQYFLFKTLLIVYPHVNTKIYTMFSKSPNLLQGVVCKCKKQVKPMSCPFLFLICPCVVCAL